MAAAVLALLLVSLAPILGDLLSQTSNRDLIIQDLVEEVAALRIESARLERRKEAPLVFLREAHPHLAPVAERGEKFKLVVGLVPNKTAGY